MDKASVPQERLLYASYSPPHHYEDGTDDGQPIVTALFFRSRPRVGELDTPSASTRSSRGICSTASPKAAAIRAGR